MVYFHGSTPSPLGHTTSGDENLASRRAYEVLLTVVSSLSMFGSLTIILTYFMFKDLQTTSRRILVYISIGDFLTVCPYMIFTWHATNNICQVQGFVTTTSVMWSFFWTSSLAIYLYVVVVKKRQETGEKLMVIFHVINWGIPLSLVATAMAVGVLGSTHARTSGGWCWIKNQEHHWQTILWMLACGKFFEVISYFINGILYFIVRRKINEDQVKGSRTLSSESNQAATQGKRKLILAPVLYVLLRMWGTIRFIMFWAKVQEGQNHWSEFLLTCHIIGDNAQGFVYFILFCVFTEKFRQNVSRMFGGKKRNTEEEQNSLIPKYHGRQSPRHKYISKDPGQITFYT